VGLPGELFWHHHTHRESSGEDNYGKVKGREEKKTEDPRAKGKQGNGYVSDRRAGKLCRRPGSHSLGGKATDRGIGVKKANLGKGKLSRGGEGQGKQ